jgi:hypothetical protein
MVSGMYEVLNIWAFLICGIKKILIKYANICIKDGKKKRLKGG